MEKANQHGIYTLNPPWRDSLNIKHHKTGDVKWSPGGAPMRGFHRSCSQNKLTCTQVKVEINTDFCSLKKFDNFRKLTRNQLRQFVQ